MRCACLILAAALLSGCSLIPQASTRIEFSGADGRRAAVTLPKNLSADSLDVAYDPVTGKVTLSAKKLNSDASQVIDSGSTAQAQAIGRLSHVVEQLLPLVPAARP